jgi:hypothetical protein
MLFLSAPRVLMRVLILTPRLSSYPGRIEDDEHYEDECESDQECGRKPSEAALDVCSEKAGVENNSLVGDTMGVGIVGKRLTRLGDTRAESCKQ